MSRAGAQPPAPLPLPFDVAVPRDGYAWWYADALSDDGAHGITLIAFLGSVFSPYYAFARDRGPADPLNHVALNVSLYGRPRRWALTDRGRGAARQEPMRLELGPSSLAWDGETLVVSVREVTAPIPRRLLGEVRITPGPMNRRVFTLDAAGRHRWCPMAPACRAEVAFEAPALRWSGTAYFDCNWGDRPLERDFVDWDWSRYALKEGAAVLYDTRRRDGSRQSLALRFDRAGRVEQVPPPPFVPLPRTLWRVTRGTQADAGASATVARTLEDTPFYARSVVRSRLFGQDVEGVHESLDLDRFRALPIRLMLPFKVPRAWFA